MPSLHPFDPWSVALIALLNPVTIVVAIVMGAKADEAKKLVIAGFAAALAGSLALWAATFLGLVHARGIGGEAGVFVLQVLFGSAWAALAYRLVGQRRLP